MLLFFAEQPVEAVYRLSYSQRCITILKLVCSSPSAALAVLKAGSSVPKPTHHLHSPWLQDIVNMTVRSGGVHG